MKYSRIVVPLQSFGIFRIAELIVDWCFYSLTILSNCNYLIGSTENFPTRQVINYDQVHLCSLQCKSAMNSRRQSNDLINFLEHETRNRGKRREVQGFRKKEKQRGVILQCGTFFTSVAKRSDKSSKEQIFNSLVHNPSTLISTG